MTSRRTDTTTPTTTNRERVTRPAPIATPATDPRNERLWQAPSDDPDAMETAPPAPVRLYKPPGKTRGR